MIGARVPRFGGPEVIEIVEQDAPVAGPGQRVVEVNVAAVNASDLLMRAGTYPKGPTPPFVPGIEGAGIDDRGRRVAFLTKAGAHAAKVVVNDAACLVLPDELSLHEGAGLLVSYLTAYHALATAAQVQHGDVVLVHAAAGGLGTALVQLAREHGANVYGTSSTPEKRGYVASLGATPRAYDDLGDLRPDIVIDPVGGRLTRDSLRLLPPFGRLVLVGLAAAEPTPLDAASLIHRSLCVHGVHLDAIVADEGLRSRALAVVMPWLLNGRIEVQLGHVLPLAELARAHELIARRETAGKLLVELT